MYINVHGTTDSQKFSTINYSHEARRSLTQQTGVYLLRLSVSEMVGRLAGGLRTVGLGVERSARDGTGGGGRPAAPGEPPAAAAAVLSDWVRFLAGMGGGAALLRSMNETALASSGLCGARGGLLRRLSLTLVRTTGCGLSGSVRVAASVNESRGDDDDSLAKLSLT